MITNRDLDRQLGTWFEARATSLPPDGLLERAWPMWARRGSGPAGWSPTAGGRAMVGRARHRPRRGSCWCSSRCCVVAIAATAVGGLVQSPVGLDRPAGAVAIGLIAATPLPSEAVTEPDRGSRRRPRTAPRRCGPARSQGCPTSWPPPITVAWAATPLGLYRTEDTGKTWTDVDPQGWSSHTAVSLVDADTVYVASGGSPATIIATHDGGASWVGASLDVGAISGGPVFSFQTPADGFATFFDPNGTKPIHVYATTDGGVTWTGPKAGKVPHLAASMDKLYRPIGGFMFQSAGKFDNKPFDNRFFLSADGGATWTQYTFPIGGALPRRMP